jgi:hypothetical protein
MTIVFLILEALSPLAKAPHLKKGKQWHRHGSGMPILLQTGWRRRLGRRGSSPLGYTPIRSRRLWYDASSASIPHKEAALVMNSL